MVRIGTGYGTEKILTDQACKEILNEVMIPLLKKEKYFEGLKRGMKQLINKWMQ